MIDDLACSLCGCYFYNKASDTLHEHGYPVVCEDCWDDLTQDEKENYQKASFLIT